MRIQYDMQKVREMMCQTFPSPVPEIQAMPVHVAATIMREQLHRSPSWEKKSCTPIQKLAVHVDTVIVLLLDLDDTRYVLLEDAHKFHRISAHYLCTDKLLNGFSAAVIHPAAKGSHDRMLGFLRDRLGWKGFCFQHSVLSTTHCVNS